MEELQIIAVMFAYMVILRAFSIAFIIYNRGLGQADANEDSLPFNWSFEQKREFLYDRAKRRQKSRWMITIILPLFVTLCADFIIIQTIPTLKDLFFR